MAKRLQKFLKSFTLIELIIVIAIIAVLGVSAFLLLTHWLGKGRDSRRITDVRTIQKALEINFIAKEDGKYPRPDGPVKVTSYQGELWEQGKFGTGLSDYVGGMNRLPKDPEGNYYEYSITLDAKFYQIMGLLESKDKSAMYYDRVYAGDEITFIASNFNRYLLAKNLSGEFTIINTPTIITNPENLENAQGGEVEIDLTKDVLDEDEKVTKPADVKLVDISTLFDNDLTNDNETYLNLRQDLGPLTTKPVVVQMIGTKGGSIDMNLVPKENCEASSKDGYNFTMILHGESQTQIKNTTVANGEKQTSMTAVCNDSIITYGEEITVTNCNTNYVLNGGECVQDLCKGTMPENAEQNGTQSVTATWMYNEVSGVCKFKCVSGYHYEGGACQPNNCDPQQKTIGSNVYNIGAMLNEATLLVVSQPNSIENGTLSYEQTFKCDKGEAIAQGTQTASIPLCDSGYRASGASCVPKDCVSIMMSVDGKNYIVPDMNNGTVVNVDSQPIAIVGGTITYKKGFGCSMGLVGSTVGVAQTNTPVCETGYSASGDSCVPNNCTATNKTVNTHIYNVGAINHGNTSLVTSNDVIVSNGKENYKQLFECDKGETKVSGEETKILTCNSGYVESNGVCTKDDCQGTLPANAEQNGTQSLAATWGYSTTAGVCKYKCSAGFHYDNGQCVTNNCAATTKTVNGHTYNVSVLTDGATIQETSSQVTITGGTITYKQTFQCNVSVVSTSGGETADTPVCSTGYTASGTSCVPNNCGATTKTVNGHTYSVGAINHGSTLQVNSSSVSITNGNVTYKQTFQCSLGVTTASGTETMNTPVCNIGYSVSGSSCVINTYTVSGSFTNGNGATINVCGSNVTAATDGTFTTTRNYGSTCNNITATRTGYVCNTTTQGPLSLSANVTNIAGTCSAIVNGACGTANGVATTAAPSANLCSAGNASAVTTATGTYTWSCEGINTGTDASCTAPRQYTVTFNGNGGTAGTSSKAVTYNTALGTLSTATRSGYTLNGWYTATSGGTQITTATVITANITYYAQWTAIVNGSCGTANGVATTAAPSANLCSAGTASTVTTNTGTYTWTCNGSNTGTDASCSAPRQYTVTFNGNGGTAGTASKIVTYNTAVGTLSTATRSGYTLDGWYTAASGGTQITTATVITTNITYYAQWTAIVNGSCGTANGAATTAVPSANLCSAGTASTVTTNTGIYTWTCNGSNTGTDASCSAPRQYTVTFNGNGGTAGTASKIVTYNTAVGTLSTATRSGYTLNGWYTATSGGTQITTATVITANITYYAQWTAIVNGACGTANGVATTAAPSANLCSAGTATAVTTATGTYTWSCEGINTGTDVSCTAPRQYTVTFNGNGGTAGTATKAVTYNTAVGTLSTATRSGYTLNGWYTATSGGTQITTATVITANITYYAQWTINTYTVSGSFGTNANGATINVCGSNVTADASGNFSRTGVGYGTNCSNITATRTGYTCNATTQGPTSLSSNTTNIAGSCELNSRNVGSWGVCSEVCGGGTQTRSVVCKNPSGITIADVNCLSVKPVTSQVCNTERCGDAWSLLSYGYRKSITIGGLPTSSTNYPLSITINTSALISSSQLKSDCSDMRFYSPSGTQLSYRLESGCNTTSTKVWVKIPSITAFSQYIYMYYNNPSAGSESNGVNVFPFFETFASTSGRGVSVNSDTTCSSSWDGRGYGVGNGNFNIGSSAAPVTENFTGRLGGRVMLVWSSCGDDYGVTKAIPYNGSNYRLIYYYSTKHDSYSNYNPPSGSTYYYYNGSSWAGLSYLGSAYNWNRVEIQSPATIGFRAKDSDGTHVNSTNIVVSEIFVRPYLPAEPSISVGAAEPY